MSVYTATRLTYGQFYELAHAVRATGAASWVEATGAASLTFTPDLTTAEKATLDDLVSAYHTRDVELSLAEYQAIKPALADARTQRLRTDQQWTALTAAQRDTQLIAWCRDITDVLRALLRDG